MVAQADPNLAEAVVLRCSVKKVFLKSAPNSQENTCDGVFFNKTSSLNICDFIKKRLQERGF